MKNRLTCSLLAAGGLALLTLPAFANKDETADVKFRTMDADGDGKVTRAEFTAYDQQRHTKLDTNGDGAISLSELSADDALGRDASDKFKKLDTDGDGKLSAAEQKAGCDAKFTSLDTDGDGALSQSEMMAAHKDKAKKDKKY